jgi:hypothetical protein
VRVCGRRDCSRVSVCVCVCVLVCVCACWCVCVSLLSSLHAHCQHAVHFTYRAVAPLHLRQKSQEVRQVFPGHTSFAFGDLRAHLKMKRKTHERMQQMMRGLMPSYGLQRKREQTCSSRSKMKRVIERRTRSGESGRKGARL